MDNPKSEFLMALGRFVICFSKIQNILQEGIYVLSTKIHSTEDAMVRRFMHKIEMTQLEDIFLTLATEYGSKCAHIDNDQLKLIRKKISSQIEELKEFRNKVMHSVWDEKFWEDQPGQRKYRMLYHKNKKFKFELDDEEFDHKKLDEYSRKSIYLENFIHDFLVCISDGDSQPDKNFKSYFEFSSKGAVFPRQGDIERFRNIDSYI